jgi:hypothetical protein
VEETGVSPDPLITLSLLLLQPLLLNHLHLSNNYGKPLTLVINLLTQKLNFLLITSLTRFHFYHFLSTFCKFLFLGMSFSCSFLIFLSGYVILMQMNNGWVGLEKAPDGSFKKKIHGSVVFFLLHYYCQVLFLIVECGFGFLQIRVMAFV